MISEINEYLKLKNSENKKDYDRFIFETLMKDKDFSVRMTVIRNDKLPVDLLETLTFDNECEIAKEAKLMLSRRMKYGKS